MAFGRCLALARARKQSIFVPRGVFRISDRAVFDGAGENLLEAHIEIFGEGAESVLHFYNERFPSMYGLAIGGEGVAVRDLTLSVANTGTGWTAAACVTGDTVDLTIDSVRFVGVGNSGRKFALMSNQADISGLTIRNCTFEQLDYALFRETGDPAVHSGFVIADCTLRDCLVGFEMNAPGLILATPREGSKILSNLKTIDGQPYPADRLRVGRELRSPVLASGTVVAAVLDKSAIELSRPPLPTANGSVQRVSAGRCSNGRIERLRCSRIGQWAVGLANCDHWVIDVQGEDVGLELVHIEDATRHVAVTVKGRRTNLEPGVVGSPSAPNGMVNIITGSHDISVHFDNVDLGADLLPARNAVCILAGGPMGTTGAEVAPHGITLSGTLFLGSNDRAVAAYNASLMFDALTVLDSRADAARKPLMVLNGCSWKGKLRLATVRPVVEPHADARGAFDLIERIAEAGGPGVSRPPP